MYCSVSVFNHHVLFCFKVQLPCILLLLCSLHHVLFYVNHHVLYCFYFHLTMYCSMFNHHVWFHFYVHFTMCCSVSTSTSPSIVVSTSTSPCIVSTSTSPCIILFPHPLHHVSFCFHIHFTMYHSVSTSTSPCIILFPHPLHHVLFCSYLELFKKEPATTLFSSFFKNNLGVAAVSIKNCPGRSKTVYLLNAKRMNMMAVSTKTCAWSKTW